MKQIKWLVILLLLTIVFGCTSKPTYKEVSYKGILELCDDKSDGDMLIYNQCLIHQNKAIGKLIIYLGNTFDVEGYQECLEKNTDNKNRSDLVKVSMCLGLGAIGDAI